MTDTPVETHVVVDDEDGGERAIHFQEWWVRLRGGGAGAPVRRGRAWTGATAAPGVLDAIRTADVVLLPPSNPVVSIGIILGVPGVRDALRGTAAPVVGVSPLISGRPVRGHADACLRGDRGRRRRRRPWPGSTRTSSTAGWSSEEDADVVSSGAARGRGAGRC